MFVVVLFAGKFEFEAEKTKGRRATSFGEPWGNLKRLSDFDCDFSEVAPSSDLAVEQIHIHLLNL